ncbi:hypothetical protein BJV82DRAFT_592266 [Fennellomyces sp. T-0311]|nr:hypothetical protein BJV82DRAFT_592266 [Fennellomyces sp. T-0311]
MPLKIFPYLFWINHFGVAFSKNVMLFFLIIDSVHNTYDQIISNKLSLAVTAVYQLPEY